MLRLHLRMFPCLAASLGLFKPSLLCFLGRENVLSRHLHRLLSQCRTVSTSNRASDDRMHELVCSYAEMRSKTWQNSDYLKCREWEYANNVSNLLIMFLWFRVEMHTSVSLWCESLSFPCTSLMFVWNLVNLEKRFVADKWSSLLNPQKEMKEVFFCSGPFDISGSEICIGPEEPNWLISSLNWFKGELQKNDRTDNCMEHRVRVLLCTAGQLTKMRLLVSFCLQEKHCRQFKILN